MSERRLAEDVQCLRSDLDRIAQAALATVAPETCLRRAVQVEGDQLHVGKTNFDLSRIQRILVVGMGKASARMAASLEDLLRERISSGLIVTADGYKVATRNVEITEASHPVPDARGLEAAERIVTLVGGASEEDLVIVLISGGGSALLPLPAPGITLSDLATTNELLLRSGAKIQEINTVRKHLSQVKGGQLARHAFPAQVLALVLSDVPGDPLHAIASGPTVGDPTTFHQAERILRQYHAWSDLPNSVRERIETGVRGESSETPKPGDDVLRRVTITVIGSGSDAAEAALVEAERLGYHTLLLTTTLEGEAREAGKLLAALAREEVKRGRPLPHPALIMAAGETTVTVRGDGRGGRNQELALSAALGIEGIPHVVIASLGTDGRDGPTDAAGGMIDGGTVRRMQERGIDPQEYLDRNDSYRALKQAGDLIVTGPTGTNVADLLFVAVAKE
ncbi:glycerate kinase [Candidatus Bipolaricaulota bacterium]